MPLLSVAAAARRLGVAPPTLRTWDRRYGLGPTGHAAGSHRRYTPADLRRLDLVRRLTLDGVSTGDAARLALGGTAVSDTTDGAAHQGGASGTGDDAPRRPAHVQLVEAAPAPTGPAVTVASLERVARALDGAHVASVLRSELARRGVVATWQDVLLPVLVGVGERWERTGHGVEVEHLVSEAAAGVLREHARREHVPPSPRSVLLACAPEEQHSLVLFALAAALAERRIPSRMLGASVPVDALAAAVRRCGPAAVFLWSQRPDTGSGATVAAVPAVRPAPTVVVGGPGWYDLPVAPRVHRVEDLPEAVALLSAVTR